jgi:pimeloyl-ACP methyl ester carboxylesterase
MNVQRPSPIVPLSIQEGTLAIHQQHLFYRRIAPPVPSGSDQTPSLVFLHEGLGCTAMWHDFPACVVRDTGLPAIVYDRPGYGRSSGRPHPRENHYLHQEAQAVLPRVLDDLRIERAILVGHSDGGSIALLAAAAIPEKIAGIITEAAHVFVEPITIEGIRKAVADYGPRQLEQRLARYHGAKARELFFAWSDTWLSESFRDWNIEDCLDRITCPALVTQGREDPYGSERQVKSIVAGIGPRARAMLIPGGHALHRDAPGLVRQAIAAFVEAL